MFFSLRAVWLVKCLIDLGRDIRDLKIFKVFVLNSEPDCVNFVHFIYSF